MATPLKTSNTIDFNSAKLHSSRTTKSSQGDLYEQRFKLSTVLQTTLDVEHLLNLFFNEILTSINLDGLRYVNGPHKLQVNCGKQTTHSCGYRLITPKDHLGEVSFYRSKRFSENDLACIETFLSTLLCPLRNAVHYDEAIKAALTDPLTGSGNRIALTNTLRREIDLATRHQQPLALLMLDIDDFKLINDNHGHSAGDEILKQLVNSIALANRCTDICFRYGGEEFLVILNKTNLEGATVIAERLRKNIENLKIKIGKETVKFTVSIGATTLQEDDTSDSLFNRTDSALYAAKQNGKNQTVAI